MPVTQEAPLVDDAALARAELAIRRVAQGGMVLISDDADREDEADLCVALDHVAAHHVAFMIRHGSGIVCAAVDRTISLRLDLVPMPRRNASDDDPAFAVSLDSIEGTTTGISAHDRAITLRRLADPSLDHTAFRCPGHVMPIVARAGGVLVRRGQTEASVDLAQLAGCSPGAAICEVMCDDGTMLRGDDLVRFARRHEIPLVAVADIVAWRTRNASSISQAPVGEFVGG
jgi:3,4-dihydroxy 2-butanone 4-phosphate synthase/GTP cyclohydrolase II